MWWSRSARSRVSLDVLGEIVVGGVRLPNPFMTASGTSGHDIELGEHMPLHELGAVVVKSLFHEPWPGNPAPRVHMTQGGMMNAVGLQGPGVVSWLNESLPRLESAKVRTVVSIWGRTIDEYRRAAELLAPAMNRLVAVEVNLSCPNLEGRAGIIAHDVQMSADVVATVADVVSAPVWAKLSANTDRIVEVAQAVASSGARSLTLINTMLGLQLDPKTGRPTLGNGGGGVSGPPIHPMAVRAVSDVRSVMPEIGIVGVGGISCGRDALEMMRAGANAVQIGTASFADPAATWKIAREATHLARSWGVKHWSTAFQQ